MLKLFRRSKSEIYLHFVWATHSRQPLISPEIEREVYRCIQMEAQSMGCDVLALNGTPDHVHLFVKMPTKLAPAQIAQQVKGVSTAFVRDQLKPVQRFGWQDGYGVFSISRSHLKRVVKYVDNQKQHHASGKI